MCGSGSSYLQIYENISTKLTKSLNPSQNEGKYKKNTRNISSKLDRFSAIAMERLSVTRMSSWAKLELNSPE